MRPEVRIIDHQQEEIKPANISKTEEEMLLQKYGYGHSAQPQKQQKPYDPKQDMSFEELCRLEDQKIKEEKMRRHQQRTGPKPITFDGDYNSNTTFSSDDDGISFKVNIVSDMEIPKDNRY